MKFRANPTPAMRRKLLGNIDISVQEPPATNFAAIPTTTTQKDSPFDPAYAAASLIGTAVGAYHGYKRNDSVGWAIAWSFFGAVAPIVAVPIAVAQGLGERKED